MSDDEIGRSVDDIPVVVVGVVGGHSCCRSGHVESSHNRRAVVDDANAEAFYSVDEVVGCGVAFVLEESLEVVVERQFDHHAVALRETNDVVEEDSAVDVDGAVGVVGGVLEQTVGELIDFEMQVVVVLSVVGSRVDFGHSEREDDRVDGEVLVEFDAVVVVDRDLSVEDSFGGAECRVGIEAHQNIAEA